MKIELTEWELMKLSSYAASQAIVYIQHEALGHLRPGEIEEGKRWRELSRKLTLEKESEAA